MAFPMVFFAIPFKESLAVEEGEGMVIMMHLKELFILTRGEEELEVGCTGVDKTLSCLGDVWPCKVSLVD